MQTKYQKLTEAVRVAMVAVDVADKSCQSARHEWSEAGRPDGQMFDAVIFAHEEWERARSTMRRAESAVKRHCEMIRAELASMQDGGL